MTYLKSGFQIELTPTASQTVGGVTYNTKTGLHEQVGEMNIFGLAKLGTHTRVLQVNGKSIRPHIETNLAITAGAPFIFPDPENRQRDPSTAEKILS